MRGSGFRGRIPSLTLMLATNKPTPAVLVGVEIAGRSVAPSGAEFDIRMPDYSVNLA